MKRDDESFGWIEWMWNQLNWNVRVYFGIFDVGLQLRYLKCVSKLQTSCQYSEMLLLFVLFGLLAGIIIWIKYMGSE